jgi:nucleoside-diphosphate-sugar epimerase
MSTKKYNALVLGANGLVGSQLVDLLLKNDKYSMVYAVSRTGIDRDNPIFRPSLLKGKRNENRFFEKMAGIFSSLMDMLLVGRFKNLRSIDAAKVASAMVHIATFSSKGVYIYKTEEIKKIA